MSKSQVEQIPKIMGKHPPKMYGVGKRGHFNYHDRPTNRPSTGKNPRR